VKERKGKKRGDNENAPVTVVPVVRAQASEMDKSYSRPNNINVVGSVFTYYSLSVIMRLIQW